MLDVDIPGKRRRGRPNQRWKDASKRDMTEAVLKDDHTTQMGSMKKSSAIPATRDDGTSQGQRRCNVLQHGNCIWTLSRE